MVYAILLAICLVTAALTFWAGQVVEREKWVLKDRINTELERSSYRRMRGRDDTGHEYP